MKTTVNTFKNAKERKEKITMLTAYDYSTAKLVDESGVESILVGDSLGMVCLGYEDTLSVTMEDMIHHSAAVARGAKNAMVITDMPFMSYQTSVYDALVNAGFDVICHATNHALDQGKKGLKNCLNFWKNSCVLSSEPAKNMEPSPTPFTKAENIFSPISHVSSLLL